MNQKAYRTWLHSGKPKSEQERRRKRARMMEDFDLKLGASLYRYITSLQEKSSGNGNTQAMGC
jgi:hypothetical protein